MAQSAQPRRGVASQHTLRAPAHVTCSRGRLWTALIDHTRHRTAPTCLSAAPNVPAFARSEAHTEQRKLSLGTRLPNQDICRISFLDCAHSLQHFLLPSITLRTLPSHPALLHLLLSANATRYRPTTITIRYENAPLPVIGASRRSSEDIDRLPDRNS